MTTNIQKRSCMRTGEDQISTSWTSFIISWGWNLIIIYMEPSWDQTLRDSQICQTQVLQPNWYSTVSWGTWPDSGWPRLVRQGRKGSIISFLWDRVENLFLLRGKAVSAIESVLHMRDLFLLRAFCWIRFPSRRPLDSNLVHASYSWRGKGVSGTNSFQGRSLDRGENPSQVLPWRVGLEWLWLNAMMRDSMF